MRERVGIDGDVLAPEVRTTVTEAWAAREYHCGRKDPLSGGGEGDVLFPDGSEVDVWDGGWWGSERTSHLTPGPAVRLRPEAGCFRRVSGGVTAPASWREAAE